MVAEGRVNGGQPVVLFVDTGFAGGGFTCPESTLREAGITVDSSKVRESQGGGGGVRSVPLVVAELQLGSARQANIPGAFGLFPPSLEYGRGFRIGGLVSHVFFRSYALTLDFDAMRYSLAAP
jgi:hypothetical protein